MSDENDYWERECNNEEVPFLSCIDLCCMDCNSVLSCMYVCSNAQRRTCPYRKNKTDRHNRWWQTLSV